LRFQFLRTQFKECHCVGKLHRNREFYTNLCDGSFTGTFQRTAANGGTISSSFMGQLIPTATQGVFYNVETAIITGGTGRFRHATGMLNLYAQVNFGRAALARH
jgi:hypothetical protein